MRRITAIVLSIAVVFSMAFGVLADAAEETGSDVTQEESLLATNAETDGEEDGLELEIGGVDANTVTVSDGESENLALGKSATMSSSSNKAYENITDGDLTTFANTYGAGTQAHTVTIDLEEATKFTKVVIYAKNSKKIYSWEVQYSNDNSTWSTAATGTDSSSADWTGDNALEVTFSEKEARYVRFAVTATRDGSTNAGDSTGGGNYSGVAIQYCEIEVYYEASTEPIPTLELSGSSTVNLLLGHDYEEPGFTADDGSGNDISSQVQVTNNVNNKKTGAYTVVYSIPDLELSVTRTVTVYADPVNVAAPNGTSIGNALTLSYTNTDYDGANVTYQWMRADSAAGEYSAIDGATNKTYTAQLADKGKYLRCAVTLGDGIEAVTTTNAALVGNLAFGKVLTGSSGAFQNDTQKSNLTDGNETTTARTQYSNQGKDPDTGATITVDTPGDAAFTYCIDLGSAQYMDRMVVRQQSQSRAKLYAWKVQYSNEESPSTAADSTDWTDVETTDSLMDQTSWTEKTITFTPVKARHIRFVVMSINIGWGGVYYLTEIEVLNTHATEKPVITLNGDATMSLEVGDTFTDPGATAIDADGLSEIAVTVGGDTVNTAVAGTYTITYDVMGSNGVAADTVTRMVSVLAPNPPVITLLGDAALTVSQGRTFTDPGATAVDADGNDITSRIVVTGTVDTTTVGTYTLTYNVTDAKGTAAAAVTRTVTVTEAKPTITLKGDATMSVVQSGTFTDPGATAVDADGNDISSSIVVTGTVDTATAGTYTLTYNVTDANGVAADAVTRTVKVVSKSVTLAYTSALPGGVLSASYEYDIYDMDNGASYQWLRASTMNGDYTAIAGATDATYTLTGADAGSYIKLQITPYRSAAVVTANHVSVGNLVLGKSVTGLSHSANSKENINDGNASSYAQSYGSTKAGENYTFDLGAEYEVSMMRMYTQGSSEKKIKHMSIQYTTSTSGNADWITALEVEIGSTETITECVYTFDRVTARRVRLYIGEIQDETYSGAWYINELEFYNAPTSAPTLTLNGNSTIMVETGTEFVDPGVTAVDGAGADLTDLVVVSGDTVNTSTPGTYTIYYDVTDAWGNVAETVSRTVIVTERDTTAPVIYLNGASTIRIHQNSTWEDPGAYAIDNVDTDVTVTVGGETVNTAVLGQYVVTYNAADASGNQATQVTRTVVVVEEGEDIEPPVVTLKGEAEVEVWQGYTYEEAGATATDDGTDVTSKIVITGSVDTKVIGDYVITYSVTDAAGNIGVATRMVHVVDEPAIEKDTRELEIEGASNLQAIVSDLILRIKGTYGSTITWSSSNESVIRPDGTVIRPNTNTSVILTATITNGDEVRTKTFDPVTVLRATGTTGGPSGGGGGGHTSSSTVTGTGGTTTGTDITTNPQTPTQSGNGTLSGFSDMDQALWADLAVSELTKRSIISGMGDGTFEPARAITREEFVKIIVEACGFTSSAATIEFSDVSTQEWYYPYVASAAGVGIITGMGDGTFGVGRAITREEMAAIICRAAQVKGIELKTDTARETFTDDSMISDWAQEDVYTLQQAGVINGMGDGSFAPGQSCTRAEAAKVVYELTKYMW